MARLLIFYTFFIYAQKPLLQKYYLKLVKIFMYSITRITQGWREMENTPVLRAIRTSLTDNFSVAFNKVCIFE